MRTAFALRGRIAVVAALSACAVPASLFSTSTAFAQQPADPVKEVARQRFQEGVKAFDAGKFEDARLAFEQAYTLSQSPAVLLNLGLAEVRTNRCVQGGNHLLKFLRDHKEASLEQRASANANIEDCKKKVGLIAISVDLPGADVTIDGANVGKSPLLDPVFVEPGTRSVIANLNGRTASASVEAKKGQTVVATLAVKGPDTNPNPNPNPDPNNGQPAPFIPQPNPNPNPTPFVPPGNQPPNDTTDDKDFGAWAVSSPLFWVGSGVFAVGLGLGIGFSVAATNSKSDAEDLALRLRNQADVDGVDGAPCDEEGASDVYPESCEQLRDALSVHNANVGVAATGFVLAALAAGGTIAYVMIDFVNGSSDKDKEASASGTAQNLMVAPWISPDLVGGAVGGRF